MRPSSWKHHERIYIPSHEDAKVNANALLITPAAAPVCACATRIPFMHNTVAAVAHPGRIIINLLTRLLALSRLSSARLVIHLLAFSWMHFRQQQLLVANLVGPRQVLRLASMPRETMRERGAFSTCTISQHCKWVSEWLLLIAGWKPHGRTLLQAKSFLGLAPLCHSGGFAEATLAIHLHFKGTW